MPQSSLRIRLPMRDGARLDTWIWLPEGAEGPVPAILQRTPYQEHVMGWERQGTLRYCEAGYALVIQVIRGVGTSEGTFSFNSPHDRTDGYDTIEWIAGQAWCDGAVGMDGSSYVAMTQLTAATTRPPHLKCIIPSVGAVGSFYDAPYFGGVFSRMHTINWTNLISVDRLEDAKGGFASTIPILTQPDWLARMRSRPAKNAADGVLFGDKLGHYLDALAHPTLDDWWRARMITREDFDRIDVPALVVTGSYEIESGALNIWRGLDRHDVERLLLIGPWDHGQAYVGGVETHGPFEHGPQGVLDILSLRLAFFDKHLKGQGDGPDLGGKVRLFVSGAKRWLSFDAYPPREAETHTLFLHSGGRANSVRGDGALGPGPCGAAEPPDRLVSDPELPFIPVLASVTEPAPAFDMREIERSHDTLCFTSEALAEPLAIVGEGQVRLTIAVDAPDADIWVWLVEERLDGTSVRLAWGALRLRYREGFGREVLLEPGAPTTIEIPLTFVGHQLSPGGRIRLTLTPSNFPLWDCNPHTGEPIADAVTTRVATITVFHDVERSSSLALPTLPQAHLAATQ